MKWFRFYSEAMHDPKLLRLRDNSFRFWVNLLCLANDSKPRGSIPSVDDIAIVMRAKRAAVEQQLGTLISAGLIDVNPDGTMVPHNWTARQLRGDDSAEIKRNQRAKKKVPHGQSNECPPDVHGQSTECPSLESESDTDTDTSILEVCGATPPKPELASINSPELVDRTARSADEMFPTLDYGQKVRQLGASLRMDWLAEAMVRTHAGGKRDWRYVLGTYNGIASEGGIRAGPNGRPSPPALSPEEKARRLAEQVKRLKEREEASPR